MRFFFYGTLIAGSGNEVAEWLHARLEPGHAGHAIGRLYALCDPEGWYPGFVPDPAGGKVIGMVYETAPQFDADDLARLDDYEAYRPEAPDRSEFVRQAVTVCLAESGMSAEAQAYVRAKPLGEKPVMIPDGDFRAFLARRGERAFGARA